MFFNVRVYCRSAPQNSFSTTTAICVWVKECNRSLFTAACPFRASEIASWICTASATQYAQPQPQECADLLLQRKHASKRQSKEPCYCKQHQRQDQHYDHGLHLQIAIVRPESPVSQQVTGCMATLTTPKHRPRTARTANGTVRVTSILTIQLPVANATAAC